MRRSYDRNNWAETPASLKMKAQLSPDDVLIEGTFLSPLPPPFPANLPPSLPSPGYESQLITHRLNMADLYPVTPTTPDSMLLDGVGGCTALVRAGLHRQGAVFPAWPVDHQVETEGFAQLAKKLGARLVGLPTYYVYHGEFLVA
jgi:mannan polymerase complexes MNN9 subunit